MDEIFRHDMLLEQHTPYPVNVGHWGLIALDVTNSTIALYHSSPSACSFVDQLPIFKQWAEVLGVQSSLDRAWPREWNITQNYSLSILQPDGISCGIITMLNAFYVSRKSTTPEVTLENTSSYRQKLSRCLEQESLIPLL